MPGFLVYLNFYGQSLTEVYKLNSIEAKEMRLKFLKNYSDCLIVLTSSFGSPEFLPKEFRFHIYIKNMLRGRVEAGSHSTETMKCVGYLILALEPGPRLNPGLLPRCI